MFVCFYCPFTPANLYILLICTNIFIHGFQFYISLDKDWSTVETLVFSQFIFIIKSFKNLLHIRYNLPIKRGNV